MVAMRLLVVRSQSGHRVKCCLASPVHVALREQPSHVVPGRVATLLDLLVVASNISTAIFGKRSGSSSSVRLVISVVAYRYSRQGSVVLNLVLQRSQALGKSLALSGLLAVGLGRHGLVDIINGTSLR